MIWWISAVSLGISVASFLLFAISVLLPRRLAAGNFGAARAQADLEGWAKLAEAISKVIDSLSKAGPSTLTLTSSIVFMIISFLAAKG